MKNIYPVLEKRFSNIHTCFSVLNSALYFDAALLILYFQSPMVDRCLKSKEAPHRRAAYLLMAVIAEGCSEYIMTKYVCLFY